MAKAAKKKASSFPVDIKPMLATLVNSPPQNDNEYVYEVKWDGYRCIAYVVDGKVELRSRNNKSFNEKFYPVYESLKKCKTNIILDGEIIVMNDKGISDFSALQEWRSEADGRLIFYVFDILWLNGKDLTSLPLIERRKLLKKNSPSLHGILISDFFESSGKDFFSLADKLGLEGIIAKKSDSEYLPGARTTDWLKIKTEQRQDVVIGGYTLNEGSSKKFSALLVGVMNNGKLDYIGSVGTGFSQKVQEDLLKKMKPLIQRNCPFSVVPDYNKPSRFRPDPPKADVFWLKPKLVAEISYRELTRDGVLRHPSYKGLRPDKSASEAIPEKAKSTSEISNESFLKKPSKTDRATFLNPKDETQVRNVDGHEIKFTNLSKLFWPKEKISKRDMLNYYYMMAPYMLPYYKDRPQTLFRHPHGINGNAFYQKDVTGKVPEWISQFPYYSEADKRQKNFLVIKDEASILYVASLGCIEMNPWSSRTQFPDNPDWCIIDLDPDKNTFNQVIEAANVTKKILDSIGVKSFCKTSGSTGLHIYIPLSAKYTYEDSKEFGRKIASLVVKELPNYTTIERKTADRNGKMYIDFLQNRPQATVAGPYSLRPKPGAPVSMPLHWEEVKKGLKITDFNMRNAVERVRTEGDLFSGVLEQGINLEKALKVFSANFE